MGTDGNESVGMGGVLRARWRRAVTRINTSHRVALLVGLVLIGLTHPGGRLLRVELLPALLWAIPGIVWLRRQRLKSAFYDEQDKGDSALWIMLALLFVHLFSSAVSHPYFYFGGWLPSEQHNVMSMASGVSRFALLTTVFAVLLAWRKPRLIWLLVLVLVVSQVFCIDGLIHRTHGAALYRDDHPSFLYRLWVMARSLPRLFFYDPSWNGGCMSYCSVPSGLVPYGLLFWPFWRFVPLQVVYTPILCVVFILLLPGMAILSARVMRASWKSALCCGILALGSNWYYLLFLLKFGTVGSLFCTAFILPVAAALYRVLWLDKMEWWTAILLIVSSACLLAWPGAAFIAIPIGVGILASMARMTRRKWLFLSLCALAIAVLCLPLYEGLRRHSRMGSFVAVDTFSGSLLTALSQGADQLRRTCHHVNPLVLFLGIGGVWLTGLRGGCTFFLPMLMVLMLLAGWGDEFKPVFQFARLSIPMALLACLPAGLVCGRFLEGRRGWKREAACAALLALLTLSGYATSRYYRQGAGEFSTMSNVMQSVTEWIETHTDKHARILFAGSTTHGYGGGHVAFLPVLCDREMMACDYFHFSPKLVEYDYPPRQWRKRGEEAIWRFFELSNVGYILTIHSHWKQHLRRFPTHYEEITTFRQNRNHITIFRVKRPSSFFLKGRGKISTGPNAIFVKTSDTDEEMVIRYNWHDGLRAEPGVELFPVEVDEGVQFIGIRPRGVSEFKIQYGRWL